TAQLELRQRTHAPDDALFGVLTYRACVQEDDVGGSWIGSGRVSRARQMAAHELGIGQVHLAAVGLDVDGGHRNARSQFASRTASDCDFQPCRRRVFSSATGRATKTPAVGMDTFDQMEASLLYCPKCRQATPVRKRLLLVLPEGEKFDY